MKWMGFWEAAWVCAAGAIVRTQGSVGSKRSSSSNTVTRSHELHRPRLRHRFAFKVLSCSSHSQSLVYKKCYKSSLCPCYCGSSKDHEEFEIVRENIRHNLEVFILSMWYESRFFSFVCLIDWSWVPTNFTGINSTSFLLFSALQRVCKDVDVESHKSIIKQARVQHLYGRFLGTLHKEADEVNNILICYDVYSILRVFASYETYISDVLGNLCHWHDIDNCHSCASLTI